MAILLAFSEALSAFAPSRHPRLVALFLPWQQNNLGGWFVSFCLVDFPPIDVLVRSFRDRPLCHSDLAFAYPVLASVQLGVGWAARYLHSGLEHGPTPVCSFLQRPRFFCRCASACSPFVAKYCTSIFSWLWWVAVVQSAYAVVPIPMVSQSKQLPGCVCVS